LHFLVPAGRLARAAADAGLDRDPNRPSRVAAAAVSPSAATTAPAHADEVVDAPVLTPAAPIAMPATLPASLAVSGSNAVPPSVGIDLGILAGALPSAAADTSQAHVLPGAFSTPPATVAPFLVTADPGAADDGNDIYADLYDAPAVSSVEAPRPVTPLRTTPPSPVPLRTTRSRVRLATPQPLTPASPLAGHLYGFYRPSLSAAVPPSPGMSFYTAAAHASPTPAPHMPPTPVPFAGWGPSWTPAKQEVFSPSVSLPSPYPRRAPTSVAPPDAWRPPMPTAIPPSDAEHYAQRLAELHAREASLFALEQRLRDMIEQHAAALSALPVAAAPPSPGGGSSSSSTSSSTRRGSRGPAAPRGHVHPLASRSESAPPSSGTKAPPALIKQAAENVGKIRFDGKPGMPAFRWFARLRAALQGRVLSDTNLNGIFGDIDEAYLRLRTRQWFPPGPDYDPQWMVVDSDLSTWDLFADFCRNAFFRTVSEDDVKHDITQFKWSRAKDDFSFVWSQLLGLNSFLSPMYRLTDPALRELWCNSCDSAVWKNAVRNLVIPGYEGRRFDDPAVPMTAVFSAVDSHTDLATGLSDSGTSSRELEALQKQVTALERRVQQNPGLRPGARRERLNIVAFANSTAAVDKRGVPILVPQKGAPSETRDRFVSKVMTAATDFLAHYPDIPPLEDDDADDLYLLMDDPSALPD
ncbi:hypothetical protein HDU96_003543, partial [Phlyctochytrium bullatum]